MRNGTANCCSVIASAEVVDCAIYNRYRNAAQSKERRKVVRREALVIGGIFDNRKLMAAILARQSTPSLNNRGQDEFEGSVSLGSRSVFLNQLCRF